MADMARARNSSVKPFPPHNRWYEFDFSHKRLPSPDEIFQAIGEQTEAMLHAPISNLGVRGIRKAATKIAAWPEVMTEEDLRSALFNNYIFISAVGGSGGGLFRYMFGRFLSEAAEICGESRLNAISEDFKSIGDCWEELAETFRPALEAPDPERLAREAKPRLEQIAGMEQAAWEKLQVLNSA
jgi:hypothetical protein